MGDMTDAPIPARPGDLGPEALGPDAAFEAFLAAGRFMLQRSRSSRRYVFYPRVLEPLTGATDLEWVEASGGGTVYATTVSRRRSEQGGDVNIALIDLDEGVRLMSRVEAIEPDRVAVGMRVRAHVDASRTPPLLVFRPEPSEVG
jgi:uncharacterized protein